MKSKKVLVRVVLGFAFIVPMVPLFWFSYLHGLNHVDTIVSTVPGNGDTNPRGIAVVPLTLGKLARKNVLVSNFSNSSNLMGTGTTIVQIWANGQRTLFAHLNPADYDISPKRIGLTGALAALQSGWVVAGSLPTQDGTAATATDGDIFILNSMGNVVKILNGNLIHGPWDMAVLDKRTYAMLFITCVLDGTLAASPNIVNNGTIVRIVLKTPKDNGSNAPTELSRTVIGSGFAQRTDPAALIVGPTGLAVTNFLQVLAAPQAIFFSSNLYVADTLMNRIMVISRADSRTTSAGIGDLVHQGGTLNRPLGMVSVFTIPLRRPSDQPESSNISFGKFSWENLLVVNGGDGKIIEISPSSRAEAARFTLNPNGAGTLFGPAIPANHWGVYFVDDGLNALRILR